MAGSAVPEIFELQIFGIENDIKGSPVTFSRVNWLRGGDLNPRPLGYEPNELPDCSTPRHVGTRNVDLGTAHRPGVRNLSF